jgi:hypothetical protein
LKLKKKKKERETEREEFVGKDNSSGMDGEVTATQYGSAYCDCPIAVGNRYITYIEATFKSSQLQQKKRVSSHGVTEEVADIELTCKYCGGVLWTEEPRNP